MTSTILVTGAAGYLGRHVVAALLERGCGVLAFDRPGRAVDTRSSHLQGSMETLPGELVKSGMPDACIHLAWRNGFDHNSRTHVEDLSAHFRFLTSLVDNGLKSLTVLGTMHEIGYWEGEIDETTPCNPRSLYGIAKNSLRQSLTQCLPHDMTLHWIRAFYITGDDSRNQSIFTKILGWAEQGRKTFPFTLGRNRYDFISVGELARQIVATALQTEITGLVNCCTGTAISLRDRVEAFIAENGLAISPEFGAFPDRDYDSPAIWGNADRIRAILDRDDARRHPPERMKKTSIP